MRRPRRPSINRRRHKSRPPFPLTARTLCTYGAAHRGGATIAGEAAEGGSRCFGLSLEHPPLPQMYSTHRTANTVLYIWLYIYFTLFYCTFGRSGLPRPRQPKRRSRRTRRRRRRRRRQKRCAVISVAILSQDARVQHAVFCGQVAATRLTGLWLCETPAGEGV